MPRDSNGNYTLPAGNPVVTGEVISTGWANPTMSDIGAELTNSLDRQGRGGMLAPFKFVDGTNGAPGMTWTNEPTTGFYRAGAGDMRATVAGVSRMRWTSTGVDIYDAVAGQWVALSDSNGVNTAILNKANKFTQDQTIVKTSGVWAIWKDSTPSLAGRLSFNLDGTDMLGLAYYDNVVSSWRAKFAANNAMNGYFNDAHEFKNGGQTALLGKLDSNGLSVGPGPYIPTASRNTYIGASNSTGSVEIGVSIADGVNNPRAGFVATATSLGINATYSSGINTFDFNFVGTKLFAYNGDAFFSYGKPFAPRDVTGADGFNLNPPGTGGANASITGAGTVNNIQFGVSIQLTSGKSFTANAANNTTAASFQVDTNGPAYWNSDSTMTAWQWYRNNQLLAALTSSTFQLGRDITLNVRNASDYGVTISSLASPGGVYYASNATYPHHFQIDGNNKFSVLPTTIECWGGTEVRYWNAANTNLASLKYLADSGGGGQLQHSGRGAVQHWDSASLTAGGIAITTTTPAATGSPGVMFLVYE